MADLYPNADLAASGPLTLVGAGAYFSALDLSQASYIEMGDAAATGVVKVTVATPSGLTDDVEWVRGEVRIEARDNLYHGNNAVAVVHSAIPGLLAGSRGGDTVFADNPAGFNNRFILGPRSMFTAGQWTVSALGFLHVSKLRFIEIDFVDAPTASIIGPTGTVGVIDGTYLPAEWSFSSPSSFPYVAWRLQVCTDVSGTGVIYSNGAFSTATTHNIPASVLAPYIGTPLFVRVQVAHDANYGSSFIGTAEHGTYQFGVYAQATFTPTGVVTATFRASRSVGWVDTHTAAKRALLNRSHAPQVEAVLYDHYGSSSWDLDVLDGSVTIDANSQKRSRFSMTVANSELMPTANYPVRADRPLHPFGSYVQIARGVGGELVALGAGVIEQVVADKTIAGRSSVAVSGFDWSLWLADARFTYNRMRHSFSGGYSPDLVTKALVDIVTEAGLTSLLLGSSAVAVQPKYLNKLTDDRPAALDVLTDSIGWWWYADSLGRIIFEALPLTTATPLYTFTEGSGCVVERHTLTLSRTDTYDLAVAYNDTGAFIAGAFDQNPLSPIRRGAGDTDTPTVGAGEFSPGGKPFFFPSPLITSQPIAESTARTILDRKAIPAERITLSTVPMADLRPGHMIELARVDEAARRWQVESVTIPLTIEGRMSINAFIPADYVDAVT